jgi:glutathione S-transferase
MAQQTPEVIIYSYEMAPNPQKLFQFLALFNLPFKYVQIPAIMPRPMLADIGITYRRTPLLSIGSDMYIDNALILDKVCELAAEQQCDVADTTNHIEYDGLGQEVFKCAAALIPSDWSFAQDPNFRADRSELMGRPFELAALAKARPRTLSKMLTLVNMVETHFLKDDGKKFVLGGPTPTTADLHLYWSLNWGLRYHSGARPEISEATNPRVFRWLADVDSFIAGRRRETKIDMAEACQVLQRPREAADSAKSVPPHVKENQEGLVQGQRVKVTPVDTGKSHPQLGELMSLNYEQVCLKNDRGLVMHFPRLGYEVEAVREQNI